MRLSECEYYYNIRVKQIYLIHLTCCSASFQKKIIGKEHVSIKNMACFEQTAKKIRRYNFDFTRKMRTPELQPNLHVL